jgi:hypothetical protein
VNFRKNAKCSTGKESFEKIPVKDVRKASNRKSEEEKSFEILTWIEPAKNRRRQRVEGVKYTFRARKRIHIPQHTKNKECILGRIPSFEA